MYELREIDAEDVRPLRTEVLRPQFDDGEIAVFEGDDADETRHFGLLADGEHMRAVVSYMPETPPDVVRESAGSGPSLRLRGMAVAEDWQRRGLGSRLLEGSLTRLAVLDPRLDFVWCRARLSAVEFYEHHDFERCGAPFEVEVIGPHVHMWRPTLDAIA